MGLASARMRGIFLRVLLDEHGVKAMSMDSGGSNSFVCVVRFIQRSVEQGEPRAQIRSSFCVSARDEAESDVSLWRAEDGLISFDYELRGFAVAEASNYETTTMMSGTNAGEAREDVPCRVTGQAVCKFE